MILYLKTLPIFQKLINCNIRIFFLFSSNTNSTSGIEFANFPKRDLIFCLTSVESYLDLSAQDLEFGFNETRRDRILRTFVRNNFHYHLNEIFAVLKVSRHKKPLKAIC